MSFFISLAQRHRKQAVKMRERGETVISSKYHVDHILRGILVMRERCELVRWVLLTVRPSPCSVWCCLSAIRRSFCFFRRLNFDPHNRQERSYLPFCGIHNVLSTSTTLRMQNGHRAILCITNSPIRRRFAEKTKKVHFYLDKAPTHISDLA